MSGLFILHAIVLTLPPEIIANVVCGAARAQDIVADRLIAWLMAATSIPVPATHGA